MHVNNMDNIPSILHLAAIFLITIMAINSELFVLEASNFTQRHLCTVHMYINNVDTVPSSLHICSLFYIDINNP